MRKAYASQESVAKTLLFGPSDAHGLQGLAASGPFSLAPSDPEPLPGVTRTCVLADDAGVVATVARDLGRGNIEMLVDVREGA